MAAAAIPIALQYAKQGIDLGRKYKPATKIDSVLQKTGIRKRLGGNNLGKIALKGIDFAKSLGFGPIPKSGQKINYGGGRRKRRGSKRK